MMNKLIIDNKKNIITHAVFVFRCLDVKIVKIE